MLRHIDDAKTPRTRQRRIERTARHVLGQLEPRSKGRKTAPLWVCRKCGNAFVNKQQYHSCKRYRVEDVLRGKPAPVRNLFELYRKTIEAMGPVTLVAYRDRVGFMVRVRFASASPKSKWLDVAFWLRGASTPPAFAASRPSFRMYTSIRSA